MKTTIDIPDKDLKEVLRLTKAATKREAILTAVREYTRRRQLDDLAGRLRGALPDFMTQADLQAMREDGPCERPK